MLLNNTKLRSSIKALWNAFWSGGIANPLTAIEQITYLLFMKQLDKLDTERERRAEFAGEKYESLFKGNFELPGIDGKPVKIPKSELRWSHFKQLKADVMLSHMQTKVFPFIKTLNGGTGPFTKHMASAVFLIPKPSLLVESVNTIEEIYTELEEDTKKGGHSFQDIQGDVYEYLLNEIASAGKNGQFRTPRHIIKMIVELVDPRPGDRIVDPACGTGGFLLEAHSYMKTKLLSPEELAKVPPDEDGFKRASVSGKLTKKVKQTLDKSMHGFDFDQTMVRLGLMNLMMHGIDDPGIDYQDTLSKSFNQQNEYDIVLANPPFTGSLDKGDTNPMLQAGTKTELLFIERIYHLLGNGGTAAVVVPQGVLTNDKTAFKYVRELIVTKCELKAVIYMPGGVFKPYAGVATAVLLFTKAGVTENTLFYKMDGDGYSLDDKRLKQEGTGDLQDVITRYRSKQVGDSTTKWFMAPRPLLNANGFSLDFESYHNPVIPTVTYDPPSELLVRLRKLEVDIMAEIETIQRAIK